MIKIRDKEISYERRFSAFFEESSKIPDYIVGLDKCIEIFKIREPIVFTTQCAYESNYFQTTVENLNYSARALFTYFKKYFPTQEKATAFARKPRDIANLVYGGRMGNVVTSNDGWNYRGRGCIQLTGRNNYRALSEAFGMNFEQEPELLEKSPYCWYASGFYWVKHGIDKLIYGFKNDNKIKKSTFVINGGYNGLEKRIELHKNLLRWHFQFDSLYKG